MAADGIGSGAIPPGADRATIARLAGQQAIAALGNLPAGSVFSGRVVAPSGGDTWQIAVRGGVITVASPVPLTPDAVVRFVLTATGGNGPLQVRLAEQAPGATAATTSGTSALLAQLGLPETPVAVAVLDAFTAAGAPLTPSRLRHAVAVLEQAAQEPPPPGGDEAPQEERPGAPPPVSAAVRTAAQEHPPAVPLPHPASRGPGATTAAPGAPAAAAPTTTPAQGPASAVAPALVQPGVTVPAAPTPPVGTPASPAPTSARVASSTAGSPPAAAPVTEVPRPVAPGREASPPVTRGVPSASVPVAVPVPVPVAVPGPVALATVPGAPVAPASSAPASLVPVSLAADDRLPTVFALLARAGLPVTPATIGLALRAATPRLPDAATALQAWQPEVPVADVADDDGPAALRAVVTALAQAGVRPRAAAEDAPPPPAVLTTTAQAVARGDGEPLAVAAFRELAADTVLPPRHLDDYDRVVPFPLLAQGQAAPARLAIASRTTPGGQKATWMRVDCELSRLGPVSVRMSGAEGGPIAITVVARTAGARAIAAGLPDLVADLQSRGLPAAVRVVEEEPW